MRKVPRLQAVTTGLLLVALMAFAVAMSIAPAAQAADEYPCAYKGHILVDGAPVPDGTGVRVLEDSTPLMESTTGLWALDDNEFYLDGVIAAVGTVVNFEVWWDCGEGAAWIPANETAVHLIYGSVLVDLTADCASPTIHIDCNPFLFVYPGPDCDLPDALTNIGPPSIEYPDALDYVITVWGQENIFGDPGLEWVSYDPAIGAGMLGDYGLHNGQPYIMTHDDGVCTDWDMP